MTVTGLTDAELLDRARAADEAAFTALYRRHHAAVRRMAQTYRWGDPDDLVDGAFGRVVADLRQGRGPREGFRAFLFATLRAVIVDWSASGPDAHLAAVPVPVASVSGRAALGGVDREVITRAFEALPDRWQMVVWHAVVEGRDVEGLATAFDLPIETAAAVDRYARGKLRQAFLDVHLAAAPRPGCEPHRGRLAAHHRGALDEDASEGVGSHLDRCDACRDLAAALAAVGERLAHSVVPLCTAPKGGRTTAAGVGEPPDGGSAQPAGAGDASGGPGDGEPAGGSGDGAAGDGAAGDGTAGDGAPAGANGSNAEGRSRGVRELAPALAGAAVVTVLIAGLAVVGTALARDDADEPADAAVGEIDDGSSDAEPEADDPGDRRTGGDRDGEDQDAGDRSPDADDDAEGRDAGERPDERALAPPAPDAARQMYANPVPAGSAATAAPAPSPGPAPTSPPPPPPVVEPSGGPLAFWELSWFPSSPTEGTLAVTVGTPSGGSSEPSDDVLITVTFSGGVLLGEGGLDSRCSAQAGDTAGHVDVVSCAVAAPAPGGYTVVTMALATDAAGQTAGVSVTQGDVSLGGRQSVALTGTA